MKNIKQVWEAIEKGQNVYWHHKGYKVTLELANDLTDSFSVKGKHCLRVTCLSNWFGSIIVPSDLPDLFVEAT